MVRSLVYSLSEYKATESLGEGIMVNTWFKKLLLATVW